MCSFFAWVHNHVSIPNIPFKKKLRIIKPKLEMHGKHSETGSHHAERFH